MRNTIFFILLSFFFAFKGFSQTTNHYIFNRIDSLEVRSNGNTLKFPWAGGINYSQMGAMDLNFDGVKDLVVFDRTGDKISTYINKGTANTVDYEYNKDLRYKFPIVTDFLLIYDYNCDGKEDLFSYAPGGLCCYKNTSNATDGIKFEKVSNLVRSKYGSNSLNLYVTSVDIPALVDLDNDGDMDVLTFSILGSYVEHHLNKSKELYGHCDSLTFEMVNSCWGSFYENSSNNNCTLGITCKGGSGIVPTPENIGQIKSVNHAGSTLLAIDMDGDGDKDMMLGDVSHNNIVLLTNGGDATTANMTAQLDSFPAASKKVNIPIFPAGFHIDVNNDGNKDLLFAPNAGNLAENNKSVWYYKNTGTNASPIFDYAKNDFLLEDMIDVGEGAIPVFLDFDKDGLTDLAVGTGGYYQANGTLKSKLALYRNFGTASKPKYELVDADYSNLSQHNLQGLHPAFADLDGDGDSDLLAGLSDGTLVYFENTAAAGNWPIFTLSATNYQSIDVGQNAAPQLIDVDRNGLVDLLVGERSGNVNYYKNKGSSSAPVFDLSNANFGGVNVSPYGNIVGYSTPRLVDTDGVFSFFSGSLKGGIYRYIDVEGNTDGVFSVKDSTYLYINEGIRTAFDIKDVTGDGKKDMIIGNYAGGISFYINDPSKVSVNEIKKEIDYKIYPNPASDQLYIEFAQGNNSNQITKIELYNLVGEKLMSNTTISDNKMIINTTSIANGIYILQISTAEKTVIKKISIQK